MRWLNINQWQSTIISENDDLQIRLHGTYFILPCCSFLVLFDHFMCGRRMLFSYFLVALCMLLQFALMFLPHFVRLSRIRYHFDHCVKERDSGWCRMISLSEVRHNLTPMHHKLSTTLYVTELTHAATDLWLHKRSLNATFINSGPLYLARSLGSTKTRGSIRTRGISERK